MGVRRGWRLVTTLADSPEDARSVLGTMWTIRRFEEAEGLGIVRGCRDRRGDLEQL
jgi:hypothetical protein